MRDEKDQRIAPPVSEDRPEQPESALAGKRVALALIIVVAIALVATGVFMLVHNKQEGAPTQPAASAASGESSQELSKGGEERAQGDQNAASESSDKKQDDEQTEKRGTKAAGVDEKSSSSTESDSQKAGASKSATKSNSSKSKGASASKGSESESTGSKSAITVTVSIDASRAGESYSSVNMGAKSVTLSKGATVFDAIEATGVSIGGNAGYVRSIDGLAEFQRGALSGWKYAVDGVFPNMSCGSYKLAGGESVVWLYVLDPSEGL